MKFKGHQLIPFAKSLRKKSTDVERHLWSILRSKRFHNLRFRRQEPLGKYIVDFVCHEKKVVIELDGGQHNIDENKERDIERDRWIGEQGFVVIRIWNHEVNEDIDGVRERIWRECF